MQSQTYRLTVDVRVENRSELIAIAGGDNHTPVEGALFRMMVNPTTSPKECGYLLEPDCTVVRLSGDNYRLYLHATVHDADRLRAEAYREYARCWGDEPEDEMDAMELLYEVLVASSASPAPMDCGYEIQRWQRITN